NTISISNPGNNIFLLEGTIVGSVITLTWNPYEEFASGVSEYSVYRQDQYGEYVLAGTTLSDETMFTENIRQEGNEMIPGLIRYRVEARESGANPLGRQGSSRSNEIGVGVKSTVYMPNAFTPNNDLQNDVFLPVMDFIPESYKMIIFDRSGKVLFETVNPREGWNGTMNGNEKASPGVYIYHIEYQSYNGSRNEETGHVTLIYPQH
ncbi:MAG: gliding motility-associated C-terminal domain-containing protein, partial [Bacteroidales bacterium]|nr:gliding motility-associated C-terminal domain-containing protein [Bacteroidales bacterium]